MKLSKISLCIMVASVSSGCTTAPQKVHLPKAPAQLSISYAPVTLADGQGGTLLRALIDNAHVIHSCEATRSGWEMFYNEIRDKVNNEDNKKPSS